MSPASVDPYAPETSAVYQLFDSKGDLLYVGQAANPKGRFVTHAREAEWWAEVACWTVEWWPTRDAALREEKRLIAERLPRCNITNNSQELAAASQLLRRPGGRLVDIRDALRGEFQVRTMVVLGRLSASRPSVYGEWGARDLAALLRHCGVRVRRSNGQSVVRRNDVENALAGDLANAPLAAISAGQPREEAVP